MTALTAFVMVVFLMASLALVIARSVFVEKRLFL